MREEFINLLNEYAEDRAFNLERRLVTGSIIANYGVREEDGPIRYDDSLNKFSNLVYISYDSSVKGSKINMNLDGYGINRESAGNERINETNDINLASLLTSDFYVRANKNEGKPGKTKILETILTSIFSDVGLDYNFMPKEVMNMMERLFNVTFNKYEEGAENKVYISKGTFSHAFYNVKKRIRESIKSQATSNAAYENIKDLGTRLLRQSEVRADERIDLKFETPGMPGDISGFRFILPKYDSLKDQSVFAELNPLLSFTRDYKMSKEMKTEFSENMYSHLFTRIYEGTMKKIFKSTIEQGDPKKARGFCKKYSEYLEFDSRRELEVNAPMPAQQVSLLATTMNFVLGRDSSDFMYIGGMIIEHLVLGSDTGSPLTLKGINDLFDKDAKLEESRSKVEEDVKDETDNIKKGLALLEAKMEKEFESPLDKYQTIFTNVFQYGVTEEALTRNPFA